MNTIKILLTVCSLIALNALSFAEFEEKMKAQFEGLEGQFFNRGAQPAPARTFSELEKETINAIMALIAANDTNKFHQELSKKMGIGDLDEKLIELTRYKKQFLQGLSLSRSERSTHLRNIALLPEKALPEILALFEVFPEIFAAQDLNKRVLFFSNMVKLNISTPVLTKSKNAFSKLKQSGFFNDSKFSVFEIEYIILEASNYSMSEKGIVAHTKAALHLEKFGITIKRAFAILVNYLNDAKTLEKIANLPLNLGELDEAKINNYITQTPEMRALESIKDSALRGLLSQELSKHSFSPGMLRPISLIIKISPNHFGNLHESLPRIIRACVGKVPSQLLNVYERLDVGDWNGLTPKKRVDAVIAAMESPGLPIHQTPVKGLERIRSCIFDTSYHASLEAKFDDHKLTDEQIEALLPFFQDTTTFFDRRQADFNELFAFFEACVGISPEHIQKTVANKAKILKDIDNSITRIELIVDALKNEIP